MNNFNIGKYLISFQMKNNLIEVEISKGKRVIELKGIELKGLEIELYKIGYNSRLIERIIKGIKYRQ